MAKLRYIDSMRYLTLTQDSTPGTQIIGGRRLYEINGDYRLSHGS